MAAGCRPLSAFCTADCLGGVVEYEYGSGTEQAPFAVRTHQLRLFVGWRWYCFDGQTALPTPAPVRYFQSVTSGVWTAVLSRGASKNRSVGRRHSALDCCQEHCVLLRHLLWWCMRGGRVSASSLASLDWRFSTICTVATPTARPRQLRKPHTRKAGVFSTTRNPPERTWRS
jgi:hypothetical protein